MNYARIALASLGGMVVYFVYGFAMFAAWPSMKTEFLKYPNVYRPKDEICLLYTSSGSMMRSSPW